DPDFPATLRERRRGSAGASMGHDGARADAEVHDALDGRNASGDAAFDRGAVAEWSVRSTAKESEDLLCAWRRKLCVPSWPTGKCVESSRGCAWSFAALAETLS